MIIKHPMDFSTIKDKNENNDYNTVTEFKVRILKHKDRVWILNI